MPDSRVRSPRRARIVKESTEANRKAAANHRRRAKWTRVNYDGYQSTLELSNSMNPVRPKLRKAENDPQAISLEPNVDRRDIHPRPNHNSTLNDENVTSSWEQAPLTSQSLAKGKQIDRCAEYRLREYLPEGDDCDAYPTKTAFSPGTLPSPAYNDWGPMDEPVGDEATRLDNDPIWNELTNLAKDSRNHSHAQISTATGASHGADLPSPASQPLTQEITQEQLTVEVKEIYRGLTLIERRCLHVGVQQATKPADRTISGEHWRAMIALHRTLLHEHYDFLLALQHPSASPALKRLAQKYSMPSRMWDSATKHLDGMLCHWPGGENSRLASVVDFLDSARSMVQSLQETLPSMGEDWLKIVQALQEYESLLQRTCEKQGAGREGDEQTTYAPNQSHPVWSTATSNCSNAQRGHGGGREVLNQPDETPEDTLWPQYIIDTMSGWLYYGQVIASSFNTFTKVFAVLSLAAQQCRYLCWKLW